MPASRTMRARPTTPDRAQGIENPEGRLQVAELDRNAREFGVNYYPMNDVRQGIVHIVGPDSPEMIQLAAIAVKAGLTKAQWDATCAVHPTMAEELVTLKDKQTASSGAA